MIGHREAEALISARLDGPLDPAANRELAAHLATCDECRAFAEQMHLMARGIRDLPVLAPSPTVRRGVYDHIDKRRTSRSWLPSRGALAPLALAAVLVLVIAGTVLAATLPRFRDEENPVRIGAPVFETSTVVAAIVATETATLVATGIPSVEASATIITSEPATTPATVTPEPLTPTRQPFEVAFATQSPPSPATAEPTVPPVPTATSPAPAPQTAMEPPPPAATATPEPPAAPTATSVPPTATSPSPVIAAAAPTRTVAPELATSTLPPATATAVPPTATPRLVATATKPAATATLPPPTQTATPVPPSAVPPTSTPVPLTATPEPSATVVPPSPTETPAGPPTIAPRGARDQGSTATAAPPRSVRTGSAESPTLEPTQPAPEPTQTPPPMATATSEPAVVAADLPTVTAAATCQPAETVPNGPPTIAPSDGVAPPSTGDEDPCAPPSASAGSGVAEPFATTPPEPESTTDSQVVVPGATATLIESTEPVAAPTEPAAIVQLPGETATPVPADPDSATSIATNSTEEGVSVPDGPVGTSVESTGVDGSDPSESIASELPAGTAPGGPLAVSPDQNRFVIGTNGGPLWIAGFNGSLVPIDAPDPYFPVWALDGSRLLIAYYPDNPDSAALGEVDATSGSVSALTSQPDNTPTRDVPAGWLGQSAVYQRTYVNEPSRGIELWRVGADAPFWTLEGEQAYTAHPISLGQSVLLATSAGWFEVASSGDATNLGPASITGRIDEFAIGPTGMIAYASEGQLVIASVENPGNVLASPSYSASGGGFDWSPDGGRLVIADGATLTFVTQAGETIATLESSEGGLISGPYWTTRGVLFLDSDTDALRRVASPT